MPTATAIATTVADALLSIVLAPLCAACTEPLDQPTRGPVCGRCWDAIRSFTPPLCDVCGDPLVSWRAIDGACPRCSHSNHHISRSRAIGEYDGTLRAIVHAFKYGGRRSLARQLGMRLARHGDTVLAGSDLIVPVPLHRARRRARGFNQAAEIARHLPVASAEVLRRVRATVTQTDLPADERRANVEDAFAMRRGTSVRGLVVVLVDDVSTTGATLEACARVLRNAGARDVRALTAARVVSRPR